MTRPVHPPDRPHGRHDARAAARGFAAAAVLVAGVIAVSTASRAADPPAGGTSVLPQDSARALVIKTCVVCHPAELVVSKRRTPETWEKVISKMLDYGARADDAQAQQILDYFVRHFEGTDTSIGAPVPDAPPKSP